MGEALQTIEGLRVFPYTAEAITPPAAVVGWPDPIDYDQTLRRGMDVMTFPVWVAVGAVDARSSRDLLAAYLDGSGASSIKAALDGRRPKYTACDSVRVNSARIEPISIAGTPYLAAVFDVAVTGSGEG